jgi:hypothetical protein
MGSSVECVEDRPAPSGEKRLGGDKSYIQKEKISSGYKVRTIWAPLFHI